MCSIGRLRYECVVSKTLEPEGRAPLESIRTTSPFELVCIEVYNRKSMDVLVVTDHFTKMAHAYLCHDQSVKRAARQLWNKYFCVSAWRVSTILFNIWKSTFPASWHYVSVSRKGMRRCITSDWYDAEMKQDLREALATAQVNAHTRQEGQLDLFNRKMKGMSWLNSGNYKRGRNIRQKYPAVGQHLANFMLMLCPILDSPWTD